MSFKKRVDSIAQEVANQYDAWKYLKSQGDFKNKTLKHTELIISPGFTYSMGPSVNCRPTYEIKNKNITKLLKDYGFYNYADSSFHWIYFITETGKPENYHLCQRFYPENHIMSDSGKRIDELNNFLEFAMNEGILKLNEKFNLNSEEELLRSIPTKIRRYGEMQAVIICLSRVLLGEFDFVQKFYDGEIEEEKMYKKEEIKIIVDDIPNLKKIWEKHGKIVI